MLAAARAQVLHRLASRLAAGPPDGETAPKRDDQRCLSFLRVISLVALVPCLDPGPPDGEADKTPAAFHYPVRVQQNKSREEQGRAGKRGGLRATKTKAEGLLKEETAWRRRSNARILTHDE